MTDVDSDADVNASFSMRIVGIGNLVGKAAQAEFDTDMADQPEAIKDKVKGWLDRDMQADQPDKFVFFRVHQVLHAWADTLAC